jgi:cytochrome oxidase assembly protein ShyY1
VPIPVGWQARVMINKVLQYGITWTELKNMTMKEFFYILHLADWRDFSESYAAQAAEGRAR